MYKLTDIMLQNLEKDLRKFHELFQGGRCQAWQLEELIAKAIRSDFKKSEQVIWKGNGHDIGCDISVNNQYEMQIKSGVVDNGTVESQIIFYFICHFWYKFLLFLAKYVQYVSKNSQNFSSKLAKN